MKVAIIIDDGEMRLSFQQYLYEDRKLFKRVFIFNSIDTFISDAYMLTDVSVILLDMHLSAGIPPLEGFGIINRTKFLRKARVLMLTSIDDHNYTVFKWLCSNRTSYIDKERSMSTIKNAVIAMSQKGGLLQPVITKRNPPGKGASEKHSVAPLTSREKQVIQQVVDLKNEKEIAASLKLRPALVRKYIRLAFRKIQQNPSISLPVSETGAAGINYKRVG